MLTIIFLVLVLLIAYRALAGYDPVTGDYAYLSRVDVAVVEAVVALQPLAVDGEACR